MTIRLNNSFERLGATAGRGFISAVAGRSFTCAVAAGGLIWLAAAWFGVQSAAAETPPVLVVPRSEAPLQIVSPPRQVERAEGEWELVELADRRLRVPAQWLPAGAKTHRLIAVVPPAGNGPGARRFMPQKSTKKAASNGSLRFVAVDDKSLRVDEGERPVLVYNHGEIVGSQVPEHDWRRARSCYVHPVWGLDGERLTDDFPSDHYHHHGIFWAWPHVEIDGRDYDLWTCSNIRQRFVRWIDRRAGPAAAELAVENGWFIEGKKAMVEIVRLRAFRASDDARAVDFEFVWTPVDRPIALRGAEEKGYGGFSMRFAVRRKWFTAIAVPGRVSGDDLVNVRLPWADLTYPFGGASSRSGAALFVDPAAPDYPPAWLTRHFGVLCVGWPGVEGKTFPPGEPIRLAYRVWIHKSALGSDRLQRAYQGYAESAKTRWE
ncbi:MAG: PmoA family protein [Pirellulales bacterium]|nr:PmoA family protein [Pirellulales bacterium]